MTDHPHQGVGASRVRVLLVDDDEEVREMTRDALGIDGFEVIEAGDGREARLLFEAEPADVVVTDLYMPGEDGLELIEELRRFIPRVPIVAVSGGGTKGETFSLDAATALGADAVLHKPYGMAELAATIRRLVEKST
jgi:DNA-binding response OmpR family regulator